MKLYFSSKDIPELTDKPSVERSELIHKAQLKLTVPEKLILNLLKLAMLTPPFIYLARQEWLEMSIAIAISIAAFFFVFRPASLRFTAKHISKC